MDVADTSCKEIDAEISDLLALIRICTLTHTDNAVFLAADCTDLSLNGNALSMAVLDDLGGLLDVLFNTIVGTIKHDGGESRIQCLVDTFKCTVIQMQCNRYGDVLILQKAVHHVDNDVVAAHVLRSTLGNTKDNRALQLLSGLEDRLGPLKIVDIELSDCIVAGFSLLQHACCTYKIHLIFLHSTISRVPFHRTRFYHFLVKPILPHILRRCKTEAPRDRCQGHVFRTLRAYR